jgi:hypothetical protein
VPSKACISEWQNCSRAVNLGSRSQPGIPQCGSLRADSTEVESDAWNGSENSAGNAILRWPGSCCVSRFACTWRTGRCRFSGLLQSYRPYGAGAAIVISHAYFRISRRADRTHGRKCRLLAAKTVCVSKCPVVASSGVHIRKRDVARRYQPHARHDFRANGFCSSVFAACAGILFFAAASRGLELASHSFARRSPAKPGGRLLKQNAEVLKEPHATNFIS